MQNRHIHTYSEYSKYIQKGIRLIAAHLLSHIESRLQYYTEPIPHTLPTSSVHEAIIVYLLCSVIQRSKNLICLWEGSNRDPKAWLQVQGNGGEELSSSHSADKGHTVGAGPSWIVQHPPQAPAVMETAVDSSLFSFESWEGIYRMMCDGCCSCAFHALITAFDSNYYSYVLAIHFYHEISQTILIKLIIYHWGAGLSRAAARVCFAALNSGQCSPPCNHKDMFNLAPGDWGCICGVWLPTAIDKHSEQCLGAMLTKRSA